METCDTCPGQATTSYLTPRGPVLFCQHHANEFGPALNALNYPSSPIAGSPVYVPDGWKGAGYGLPVNGPDRHHF